MSFVNERNIGKLSFGYTVILIAVVTLFTGGLFIASKRQVLQSSLVVLEQEFIEQQQDLLKRDVDVLITFMSAYQANTRLAAEERLKASVEEAVDVATGIYNDMHGKADNDIIAGVIREALKSLRFNEQSGYSFILDSDGELVLSPAKLSQTYEGLSPSDQKSLAVVKKDMVAIARNHGGGVHQYDWFKPGGQPGKRYPKISYVAIFAPLNWVIGTGEYFDDLDNFSQAVLLKDFKTVLDLNNPNYFFFYKIHNIEGGRDFATMLVNSNRPDLVGKKISDDYADPDGKFFRKEFLQGVREKGEAFVTYKFEKPDGSGFGRKMSYFRLYPKWNWVVARGIYLDPLDTVLLEKKADLEEKMKNDASVLLLIFLIVTQLAVAVAYYFSVHLQRIFNSYQGKQDKYSQKLRELNATLELQNRLDSLTKIYNRSYFNKKIAEEVERATRYGSVLSMVIFDVDHFKGINDDFGHLMGDNVLEAVAQIVRENVRQMDVFARWGGEEFVILMPGIDAKQALFVAEKIRNLIAAHEFSIERQVTCSLGVSHYCPPEGTQEFFQRVDDALYQAKNSGRNKTAMRV